MAAKTSPTAKKAAPKASKAKVPNGAELLKTYALQTIRDLREQGVPADVLSALRVARKLRRAARREARAAA